ncbi:MAG: sigma 54-interacting transcriptional regulator [Desulfobacterales bacterium]|nr:sigma 54-interacting transcriptional regulator [Desulfobacterales bacterium]
MPDESPWKDIARHVPTGIFAMDTQFRVHYWNPVMEAITGIPFRRISGTCLFDFFPAINGTELNRIYENTDVSTRPLTLEYCNLFPEFHRPGHHRYYTLKTQLIRSSGQVEGSVVILEDTTDRLKSERALQESQRKLSTLMNNLPGMAYRARNDRKWTLEYVSRGSREIVGYDSEDLVGNPMNAFSERVHADDQEKIWNKIQDAVAAQKSFELFYRLRTTRGEYKWVWEQGAGVFDDNGNMVALEGYVNDFTAQKVTELELRRENERLRSTIKDRYRFGEMVGKSEAMQKVYEMILRAAATDTNVIIYGESGTGKELAARAIHDLSQRKASPFIPVNCGAISETLLESEFFGHTRGAFTGAGREKTGYLEAAHEGTLFLDELGEISLPLQVKLLRVLDEKGYQPVGSTETRHSDIRIVAATNRDLKERVRKGQMRQDFFYRIHILPIYLPSLSERKEDIPLLIDFFQDKFRAQGYDAHIPASVRETFLGYHWPGNVRELQNAVLRYITLKKIDVMDQDAPVTAPANDALFPSDSDAPLKKRLAVYEKQIIRGLLAEHQWNRTLVAKRLGIDRKTLFNKMRQHGLNTRQ